MATFEEIKGRISALTLRPLAALEETAADLLDHVVNAVVRDMQRRHDFACMETTLELETTEGTPYAPLGSGYKRMAGQLDRDTGAAGGVYYLVGGEWRRIPMVYPATGGQAVTIHTLRRLYPDPATTGPPSYCCVWRRELWLGPTPDDEYELRVPAYAYLPRLADDDGSEPAPNTNWFTEAVDDVIVHEGVALSHLYLDQPAAAAGWSGVTAEGLRTAIAVDTIEAVTRGGPRSVRVRGGD